MATVEEVAEAYADWQVRCNANTRLAKMLRGWDRTGHSVLSDLVTGLVGVPDLVVTATSEEFADLFWGDLNPSEKYISGEIVLAGSAEDVMRLDAMSMVVFLDQ
jgi:hypothetical protein